MRGLVRAGIAAIAVLGGLAGSAPAQTVVPVSITGDSANRVDLVFLGDGYTATEMSKFAGDVDTAVQGMFGQEPYREYSGYFNVRRIEVASAESGASHPGRSRNTAFGAYYNCGGTARLICLDSGRVTTALQGALTSGERDMVVVLVNDTEYGGSGGTYIVASLHPSVIELVLHEGGHGFGLLADEYGGPPPPACWDQAEPSAVNATRETNPASIKWARWIDPSTPIPTTSTTNGVPGLFAGAMYCDKTLYRPVYNSKMRSLGQAFWQVGTEQLIRRIYTYVDPIDAVSPPVSSSLTVSRGQTTTFSVSTAKPVSHALKVGWWLDGEVKSSAGEFPLDGDQLAPGPHSLQVVVADPTSAVLADPDGLLTSQARWTVSAGGAAAGDFTLRADATSLTLARGQSRTIVLTVTPSDAALAADVSLSWTGLPTNSSCSCSPVRVAAGSGATSVSLTIGTSAPTAAAVAASTRGGVALALALSLGVPALLLAAPRRRPRRLFVVVACAAALSSALLFPGCGSGNGSPGTQTPPGTANPGTPVGTYPVVVTAASPTVSHTTTISLTVQ